MNILRVIIDDTDLKQLTKDFYEYILLNIIDGLRKNNWIIKNACMLLFSRLLKNIFKAEKNLEKFNPTFLNFFNKNEEHRGKVF